MFFREADKSSVLCRSTFPSHSLWNWQVSTEHCFLNNHYNLMCDGSTTTPCLLLLFSAVTEIHSAAPRTGRRTWALQKHLKWEHDHLHVGTKEKHTWKRCLSALSCAQEPRDSDDTLQTIPACDPPDTRTLSELENNLSNTHICSRKVCTRWLLMNMHFVCLFVP